MYSPILPLFFIMFFVYLLFTHFPFYLRVLTILFSTHSYLLNPSSSRPFMSLIFFAIEQILNLHFNNFLYISIPITLKNRCTYIYSTLNNLITYYHLLLSLLLPIITYYHSSLSFLTRTLNFSYSVLLVFLLSIFF